MAVFMLLVDVNTRRIDCLTDPSWNGRRYMKITKLSACFITTYQGNWRCIQKIKTLFAHNYSILVKERKNKTRLSSLAASHLSRFRKPFFFER